MRIRRVRVHHSSTNHHCAMSDLLPSAALPSPITPFPSGVFQRNRIRPWQFVGNAMTMASKVGPHNANMDHPVGLAATSCKHVTSDDSCSGSEGHIPKKHREHLQNSQTVVSQTDGPRVSSKGKDQIEVNEGGGGLAVVNRATAGREEKERGSHTRAREGTGLLLHCLQQGRARGIYTMIGTSMLRMNVSKRGKGKETSFVSKAQLRARGPSVSGVCALAISWSKREC